MAGLITLAQQALAHFGNEAQILKFAEECCELESDRYDPSEHADVLVCLDQMKVLFGSDLRAEIDRLKTSFCVVIDKSLPKAAQHAIKYTLYIRAGWDAKEIKEKLIKAIALVSFSVDFKISKQGIRAEVESIKIQKENRLYDTICRARSERIGNSDGNISSDPLTGVQRGDSEQQSGERAVQSVCEGKGGNTGVDLQISPRSQIKILQEMRNRIRMD